MAGNFFIFVLTPCVIINYHLNGVEQMPQKPLPHADFLVSAQADDVAGGVRECRDAAVVRLNAVQAGSCQQVPYAQQTVLTA